MINTYTELKHALKSFALFMCPLRVRRGSRINEWRESAQSTLSHLRCSSDYPHIALSLAFITHQKTEYPIGLSGARSKGIEANRLRITYGNRLRHVDMINAYMELKHALKSFALFMCPLRVRRESRITSGYVSAPPNMRITSDKNERLSSTCAALGRRKEE
ncbi:hypothetical protein PUN28_017100 [Cardiocondyla obscurior]|uniref:Uncharacterized protein n=1 Tax=Cardiocondyla obscurior TaxID=286306 RepID=A0AAW2EM08_9HYME